MASLPEPREALRRDLLAFLAAPGAAAFEALAARVVAYQAAALPEYGRLVAAAGGPPEGWRAAPEIFMGGFSTTMYALSCFTLLAVFSSAVRGTRKEN